MQVILVQKKHIIEVNGSNYNVTIKDSSNGNGEILYNETATNTPIRGAAIMIRRGTVTIESGKITCKNQADKLAAIEVGHGNTQDGTTPSAGHLILKGGTVDSARYGISVENGTIDINGGTVKADSYAIGTKYFATTGDENFNSTTINIKNGTVQSKQYAAIQHKNNGDLNISGGNISGTVGVYSAGGNTNITGGTITATTDVTKDTTPYGTPGDVPTGAAVVAKKDNFAGMTVTINGANLVSNASTSPVVYEAKTTSPIATVALYSNNGNSVIDVVKATSNKPIDVEYISSDLVLKITTDEGETTYYMGEETDANIQTAISELKSGKITVEEGDITLTNVPVGVKVENEGTGEVKVNGNTVSTDVTYDPLAEKLAQLEAAIEQLTGDNSALKEEVAGLKSDYESLEADMNSVLERLANIEAKYEKLVQDQNTNTTVASDELDDEPKTGDVYAVSTGIVTLVSLAGAVVSKKFIK